MKSAYGGYYTGEKNIEQTAGQAFSDFGKGASSVLSKLLPNMSNDEIDYDALNSLILNS